MTEIKNRDSRNPIDVTIPVDIFDCRTLASVDGYGPVIWIDDGSCFIPPLGIEERL